MELGDYRKKIDLIDAEIVRLFSERMDISADIARYKMENSLPVLDRGREREKLAGIVSGAEASKQKYLKALYSLVFELSRTEQNRIIENNLTAESEIFSAAGRTKSTFPESAVVACQGIEGAFSQQACEKLFSLPSIMFFESFDSVFSAVENGLCRYAVLPVENNTAGSVNKVYDLMMKYDFKMVKSTRLKVEHELLAKPGTKLSDVKEVFSHEQALSQCAGLLEKLGVKATPCANTAVAARLVRDSERTDVAALASRACAEIYGLEVIKSAAQDNGGNYTRFICISKETEIYPGADRTSIMLVTQHKPGALYNVMSHINTHGVNITKLESRPIPERDFEFMFYFDLEAPAQTENFALLMKELASSCESFRYLGSYTETV